MRPPRTTPGRRDAASPQTPRAFKSGDLVEVTSDEAGLRGSHFEAVVVGPSTNPRGGYTVEYDSLIESEDSDRPLREDVPARSVRPRPPPPASDWCPPAEHAVVDALSDGAWWLGVARAGAGAAGKVRVWFPDTREVMEFDAADVRPHLEWISGEWRSPESTVIGPEGEVDLFGVAPVQAPSATPAPERAELHQTMPRGGLLASEREGGPIFTYSRQSCKTRLQPEGSGSCTGALGAEPHQIAPKLEVVRMELGALDCPICYQPLAPPIYQCGVGHLICNVCRTTLQKCPQCPIPGFGPFLRCFGMERVVKSTEVPCCFVKNGCTEKITYFNKKEHEKACRHAPCFCPVPNCGFMGPVARLLDHFIYNHKWPSTAFKYYAQFDLCLLPGPNMLRAQDGNVFLMNVVPVDTLGHAISLVCVQPEAAEHPFGCSLVFSGSTGHCQISTLDAVRCSSLADGLPKDVFCVVPKAVGGGPVVVMTTIDRALVYDEINLEELDESEYEGLHEDDPHNFKGLHLFAAVCDEVGTSSKII